MANHKNFAETTLAAAITDTSGTSITVTSETSFPSAPFIISIDTECFLVSVVSGTTWTVTRGYEGSTAATHTNGTAIYHDISAAEADAIAGKAALAGADFTGVVSATASTYPVIECVRTSTGTNTVLTAFDVLQKTSGNMADLFGAALAFAIMDEAGVRNNIAFMQGYRSGADNSGCLSLQAVSGGTGVANHLILTPAGNVGIGTGAPLSELSINGGLHVGGDSDAGDNNALIDGTLEVTGATTLTGLTKTAGGLHVGGVSDPGADNLLVDGTLEVKGTVSSNNIVVSTTANLPLSMTNTNTSGAATGAGIVALEDDGAAIASGDRLGYMLFGGAKDASHTIMNAVGFVAYADETWGATKAGAHLEIQTTAVGGVSRTAKVYFTDVGNVSIGGNAVRASTVGTNALNIFNGVAPVGTLTNGCSVYSASGELYTMDAAGNATLQTPHDDGNYWVFDSKNTVTGKHLKIDVEKLLRALNNKFGFDFVHDLLEEV